MLAWFHHAFAVAELSMNQQSISIIIPTYNRATLVVRAVQSVLAQTVDGDEVIVVDDGSTDNTREVLAPFQNRIRYIWTKNAGCGAARNRGIREARNPLVAFHDSDDEWLPHKLTLQRALMRERPDVLYCFSDFAASSRDNQVHHRYLRNWNHDVRPWDEIVGPGITYSSMAPLPSEMGDFSVHIGSLYLDGINACHVPTFTVMIRREEAGEALHFSEDLPILEDWECFSRLAQKGLAAYLDCETAIQHGHSGPRITNASNLQRITSQLIILARVYGIDDVFLAEHGKVYWQTVNDLRRRRISALLMNQDAHTAKAEIRLMDKCPWHYRVAAFMPALLLNILVDIRKRVHIPRFVFPG